MCGRHGNYPPVIGSLLPGLELGLLVLLNHLEVLSLWVRLSPGTHPLLPLCTQDYGDVFQAMSPSGTLAHGRRLPTDLGLLSHASQFTRVWN